ncbi:hypothetical protein Droror1_Dr00009553 [Drosera rotundifolia]
MSVYIFVPSLFPAKEKKNRNNGFRKIDPEQWEFANDDFVRGQLHLLKNIHRRKPVHSHSLNNFHGQGYSTSLSESERQGYKDEVQRLKDDIQSLHSESQLQREESEIHSLRERLQHMELQHHSLISYVAQVLQKPRLALNLVPQTENHDRKRRFVGPDHSLEQANSGDNRGASPRTLHKGSHDSNSALALELEMLDRLESSITLWENIVHDVKSLENEQGSSMELAESTTCAECPARSYTQLNVDSPSDPSRIDMNVEPSAPVTASGPEAVPSKEKEEGAVTAPAARQGVNDVFWEQLLTENPGSSDTQEVQSARKESDVRDKDGNL